MTKSNRSDGAHSAGETFSEIHRVWATRLSNVYRWGAKEEGDALSLTLKCRGAGDWIAVAKRVGADGATEVIFATGFDFVSCFLALNGSMAGNRWRVDKPWVPGG